jgi:hypothetical protein
VWVITFPVPRRDARPTSHIQYIGGFTIYIDLTVDN